MDIFGLDFSEGQNREQMDDFDHFEAEEMLDMIDIGDLLFAGGSKTLKNKYQQMVIRPPPH